MPRILPIIFVFLATLTTASAHRLNSVTVRGDFRTDGTYTISLSVEPARLPVDKTAPFPPVPPEGSAPTDPDERRAIFDLADPFFRSNFTFFFDKDEITPQFTFEFEEVAEKDAVADGVSFRDGQTHLFIVASFTGKIPPASEAFLFNLGRDLDMAVMFVGTIDGEYKGRTQALFAGEESKPYPMSWARIKSEPAPDVAPAPTTLDEIPTASFWETTLKYLVVGFQHILPKGLDHIFFVLALFFLSQSLVALLWQVTAFTVAHTLTLALAYLGFVHVSSEIVEPLIALSIAVVAIENIFTKRLRPHRVAVVFAFGLLHGLGFAGAFADLHLPEEEFIQGLIFLNIGVELGQLAVIAIALLTILPFAKARPLYRYIVAIPASVFIAAVGIVATIDRVWPDSIPPALSFLQIL